MNTRDFFKKYDGKGVDWDGAYGFQCVDLYRQYVNDVLGFKQSPSVSGAADIWNTVDVNLYEKIPNSPTAIPQLGDILIWNKRAGGGYGHVAIFSDGDVNRFTSFDQNYPTGSLCAFREHNYTNVTGWLRPKTDANKPPELVACLESHTKLMDEITETKKSLSEVQTEFSRLKEDSSNQIRAAEDVAKAQKTKYEDFIGAVANKLQTTQDTATIYPEIDRLIGVEDTLNKERKSHDKTKQELTDSRSMNEKLKQEIETLKIEKLQAINLGDVSLADFINAKIKKYQMWRNS